MVDRVQAPQPTPSRRRLLARLCLFAFFVGLLVLLSSRPAEAAERREPGLLDPVSTTLKATAREVELAGRATGSGTSTVGNAVDLARRVVAPQPRPTTSAARLAAPAVKRGAPAVTSPVRRVAPPTRPVATAVRSTGAAAKPATGALTGLLEGAGTLAAKPVDGAAKAAAGPADRIAKVTAGPVGRAAKVTAGPVGRVAEVATPATGPATGPVARIAEAGGRVLARWAASRLRWPASPRR